MFSLFSKKGQSTAEYAIVIALVIAAVFAMQNYVRRGLQGRVGGASDSFTTRVEGANWTEVFGTGSGPTATLEWQWEPGQLDAQRTRKVLTGTQTEEDLQVGGTLTRDITERTQQEVGDYRQYDY